MLLTHLTSLLAAATLLMPFPSASGEDPTLSPSEWQFTRTDNEGVTWTGTLKIEKVDADRFDPNKYDFQCNIEAKSPESSRGVEGPCTYDSASRKLTLGSETTSRFFYTAVLAVDGKALVDGEYSETVDEYKNNNWAKVKKTGKWSARLAAK
jgi:hypothetical protein